MKRKLSGISGEQEKVCSEEKEQVRVLHLLTSGHTGGIESLCRDIGACSDLYNGFCFFTDAGLVCQQMQDLSLPVYDLSKQGKKFSLRKLRMAMKIAKEYSVIVVHHDDPFLQCYYILLKLLTGKRAAMQLHACYAESENSRLKRVLEEIILHMSLHCSDAIISVSHAVQKSFESRINRRKPQYVVYNGVSQALLDRGRGNTPKMNQPFDLTYVGRLSEYKGVDILIRAGRILRQQYDIRLCIVGDGEYRDDLERICREEKMEDITAFYGQQPSPEPYLEQATVFVYPTTCQEAFGISLLEAMAYGIPCVANAVGGIPELISHGESGLLCDGFTPEELAEKIQILLESDMTAMSRCARETAERFSIDNTVQNIKEILEKI